MASVRKRTWTHKGAIKTAWVVDYTDQAGKRRMKTAASKKEADKIRITIESQIERGEHHPQSDSMTVAMVCNEFMKLADQRVSDKLIGRNRRQQLDQAIRHHIVPHLGRRIFSELTVRDMEQWYATLSAKPKCSLASRSIYLEVLRRIEEFAVRRGLATRRPIQDFKLERGSHTREVIKTFDVDQVGMLLKALEERPTKHTARQHLILQCAVHLAAFCGMRRGEIFGLRLENIDLERRTLHIRHNLTAFNELKGPKTRSGVRDIPLPDHVVLLIRRFVADYYLENERGLVFTSRTGSQASFTSSFHQSWRGLLKRAGLHDEGHNKGYHFHALRHFAASWAMQMGMTPPDVAALLGHRTFDMTLQVYAHPVYGSAQRAKMVQESAESLLELTAGTVTDAAQTRQVGISH